MTGKRKIFSPTLFRKRALPWLWLGLTPSIMVDGVLLFRLVEKTLILHQRGQSISGGLLSDFAMYFLFNALLTKSVPLIVYFYTRHLLKQSHVTLYHDKVVYYQRLLVMYDLDYGYTFFHEHHFNKIDYFKQTRFGNLLIAGEHEVFCYYHDGQSKPDWCSHKNGPKIIHRRKCVIRGVFCDKDEIVGKLAELQRLQPD